MIKLSDFDYYLPQGLIAQQPLSKRDESRLLVLHRQNGKIEDRTFKDLSEYLTPDDTLVLNDTKVFPARLFGIDELKNKKIEILLIKNMVMPASLLAQEQIWEVLIKPAKKVNVGTKLQFGDKLIGELVDKKGCRGYIKFEYDGDFFEVLQEVGKTPLPPYIKREVNESDIKQYQTIYARQQGAIAVPTAGLHFTKELLEKIKNKGVNLAFITLHVGAGTFSPIRKEDIIEHQMDEEYYEVSSEAAEIINQTKGKIIVVGTTTMRTLETIVKNPKSEFQNPKSKIRIPNSKIQNPKFSILPSSGWTDLFIYPGFNFKVSDMLITNFHLPKTTLIILVSAFAGREKILSAYQHAINKGYRFYSYGDAMLIV